MRRTRPLLFALLLLAAPTAQAQNFTDSQGVEYTETNGTLSVTGYNGSGGNVVIPSSYAGLPVTSIGDSAFEANGNLTQVTLPTSLITIGNFSFTYCYALTKINILGGVTSIGHAAFFITNITSITLPKGITSIADTTFDGCGNLTQITIPDGVTSIGHYAFGASGLTHITIPASVTSIEPLAFNNCHSLSNVTIGAGVTNIGIMAFIRCYKLSIVFFKGDAPNPGSDAFEYDNLATAYYLPGKKGWGKTYSGLRALSVAVVHPRVLTQPRGVTVAGGETVKFVVKVSGASPLRFQWGKNGKPLANGGNFTGVTRPKLTIIKATAVDDGMYRVTISNFFGSTTSAAVKLTVK